MVEPIARLTQPSVNLLVLNLRTRLSVLWQEHGLHALVGEERLVNVIAGRLQDLREPDPRDSCLRQDVKPPQGCAHHLADGLGHMGEAVAHGVARWLEKT